MNVRKADKSWCMYINFAFNIKVIGVGTGVKIHFIYIFTYIVRSFSLSIFSCDAVVHF